jgi:hypothetical protein
MIPAKILAGIAPVAGIVFILALIAGIPHGQPATSRRTFGISGYLITAAVRQLAGDEQPGSSPKLSYVPGVRVILEDLINGTKSQPTRTDLSGRFTFPPHPPSRYHVCWKADGFRSNCTAAFSLVDRHRYLGPIPLFIEVVKDAKTFYGRVRFMGHRSEILQLRCLYRGTSRHVASLPGDCLRCSRNAALAGHASPLLVECRPAPAVADA